MSVPMNRRSHWMFALNSIESLELVIASLPFRCHCRQTRHVSITDGTMSVTVLGKPAAVSSACILALFTCHHLRWRIRSCLTMVGVFAERRFLRAFPRSNDVQSGSGETAKTPSSGAAAGTARTSGGGSSSPSRASAGINGTICRRFGAGRSSTSDFSLKGEESTISDGWKICTRIGTL